ncbi:MAG: ABC transporter substrate-binding protein [Chloroflexi bacterium]|nr:ABC transporter substrate-binding protein [Chloroflexota bacterium]
MSTTKRLVGMIVLMTILFVLSACAATPTPAPTPVPNTPVPAVKPTSAPTIAATAAPTTAPTAPPPPAGTVKIGAMYSLTGSGAAIGTGQMEGAKMAIDEINKNGGINIGGVKMKIEGVFRDDESNPQVAVARFNEIVKDQKATALVAGSMGNISVALNEEVKKTKTLFIATNGVPEDFFKKEVKAPTSLCIVAASEWAGRGAAAYMVDQMKAKRIANFMPDYSIGQGTMKGFEAVMKDRKGVEFTTIWHPVNSPDLTSYLIKSLEYKPDVVFVGSWGADAVNALKQALEMGAGKKAPLFHFWLMNAFATGIPANAMEGVKGQMFWYHDMRGFSDADVVKASEEFVTKWMQGRKEPPDPYAMSTYYGVMEIARAMELSKSTDPDKMYAALMDNPDWKGAKGPAKWRKDGAVVYKYSTWIVAGKGAAERKSDRYDAKFDFAKIVDVYSGDAFVPPLSAMGY